MDNPREAEKWQQSDIGTFAKLPKELREQTFGLVLNSRYPLARTEHARERLKHGQDLRFFCGPPWYHAILEGKEIVCLDIGLLSTCKQIFHEAHSEMIRSNVFIWDFRPPSRLPQRSKPRQYLRQASEGFLIKGKLSRRMFGSKATRTDEAARLPIPLRPLPAIMPNVRYLSIREGCDPESHWACNHGYELRRILRTLRDRRIFPRLERLTIDVGGQECNMFYHLKVLESVRTELIESGEEVEYVSLGRTRLLKEGLPVVNIEHRYVAEAWDFFVALHKEDPRIQCLNKAAREPGSLQDDLSRIVRYIDVEYRKQEAGEGRGTWNGTEGLLESVGDVVRRMTRDQEVFTANCPILEARRKLERTPGTREKHLVYGWVMQIMTGSLSASKEPDL
jgi:hypothetical protein